MEVERTGQEKSVLFCCAIILIIVNTNISRAEVQQGHDHRLLVYLMLVFQIS